MISRNLRRKKKVWGRKGDRAAAGCGFQEAEQPFERGVFHTAAGPR